MKELFKFDEDNLTENNTDIKHLSDSIELINQLPISKEERDTIIEQEIKLFHQNRQSKINNYINKEESDNLLSEAITTVLNIRFELILPQSITKYYNTVLLVCKFLKYKMESFEKNKYQILYNGRIYIKKIHHSIDFEWCQKAIKEHIKSEVISIEKNAKNSIKYSSVDTMHTVVLALQGFLLNIYSDPLLMYEFFGFYKKEELDILTTQNTKDALND